MKFNKNYKTMGYAMVPIDIIIPLDEGQAPDDVAVNYINQYNNAKVKIKEATEAKDKAEYILKSLLGENEARTVGGFKVTWKM